MERDIKPARRTGLRQSAAGDQASPARTERIRASRQMEKVAVEIRATTTLSWNGGIVIPVPADASKAAIEAAIVQHLMANDRVMQWDWSEPPKLNDWWFSENEASE